MTAPILIGLLIYAAVFGGFTGLVATSKNRDGFLWFILGALFGIIALLAVIGMPAAPKAEWPAAPAPETPGPVAQRAAAIVADRKRRGY